MIQALVEVEARDWYRDRFGVEVEAVGRGERMVYRYLRRYEV